MNRRHLISGAAALPVAGLATAASAAAADDPAVRTEGHAAGAHFSNTESWFIDGDPVSRGTIYALMPVLWESPAAAELFPRTSPPVDPERLA